MDGYMASVWEDDEMMMLMKKLPHIVVIFQTTFSNEDATAALVSSRK